MKRLVIIFFLCALSYGGRAQKVVRCGDVALLHSIRKYQPSFLVANSRPYQKRNTGKSQFAAVTIPVIFHIVLNAEQIAELGGSSMITKRVLAQLDVINKDFSAANTDDLSVLPDEFSAVVGNPKIQFALAQKNLDGFETEGFQVQQTLQEGFNFHGTEGSTLGFSDAKYFISDGDQAWDPTSYLNIWVINPLTDNGDQILGLTIPHSYVGGVSNIPLKEEGIVIHYKAFGVQDDNDNIFLRGAGGGRTLTHELGHYFGLAHTWGDDQGLCPDNGGEDDGIADTPPQSDANLACPDIPLYDDCSFEGPGVMFMNFMDYTPDECVAMFTKEQADKMYSTTLSGGDAHSLTQHPELLQKPLKQTGASTFHVWPNPAKGQVNIYFKQTPRSLRGISILNVLGQQVITINGYNAQAFYSFDAGRLSPGMYFIRCDFADHHVIKPVAVE